MPTECATCLHLSGNKGDFCEQTELQCNKELISVMMLPLRVAIIKCQAHRKGNDDVIHGNNAADEEAKTAAKCQVAILAPVVTMAPVGTPEEIIRIQKEASKY